MVQLIGFMIGGYVWVRMLQTAMDSSAPAIVRIFAGLMLAADTFLLIFLFAAGSVDLPRARP